MTSLPKRPLYRALQAQYCINLQSMYARQISRILLIIAGTWVAAEKANAQQDVLPSIPKGTISVNLQTVASGLGAPD